MGRLWDFIMTALGHLLPQLAVPTCLDREGRPLTVPSWEFQTNASATAHTLSHTSLVPPPTHPSLTPFHHPSQSIAFKLSLS